MGILTIILILVNIITLIRTLIICKRVTGSIKKMVFSLGEIALSFIGAFIVLSKGINNQGAVVYIQYFFGAIFLSLFIHSIVRQIKLNKGLKSKSILIYIITLITLPVFTFLTFVFAILYALSIFT